MPSSGTTSSTSATQLSTILLVNPPSSTSGLVTKPFLSPVSRYVLVGTHCEYSDYTKVSLPLITCSGGCTMKLSYRKEITLGLPGFFHLLLCRPQQLGLPCQRRHSVLLLVRGNQRLDDSVARVMEVNLKDGTPHETRSQYIIIPLTKYHGARALTVCTVQGAQYRHTQVSWTFVTRRKLPFIPAPFVKATPAVGQRYSAYKPGSGIHCARAPDIFACARSIQGQFVQFLNS